jgi:hypothetical protein
MSQRPGEILAEISLKTKRPRKLAGKEFEEIKKRILSNLF